MESKFDVGRLSEALVGLDETAAGLEKRLAEIRDLQKQIEGIIREAERLSSRYGIAGEIIAATAPSEPQEPSATGGEEVTFTDAVIGVFEQRPGHLLRVDDVLEKLQESRTDATKDRVRNALYYAEKQGNLHRPKGRPGTFTLRDTSTPVAAGVEVSGEPYEGSPREKGEGRDDTSALLHDQNGSTRRVPNPFDRVGNRAPIGG